MRLTALRFFIVFLFTGTFLQAQENRFVEWPFLRDICIIDTNCTHYQTARIAITTDSVYTGNTLYSIEQRKYNLKGQLVSISSTRQDTLNAPTEVVAYGLDAIGRVISASLLSISGKDTTVLFKSTVLKYDKLSYRPFLQQYHENKPDTMKQQQFIDDRLIFKYSGTQAATHWYSAYGTDYFIRTSYDKPGYGWVQDMTHLHIKDTLYRRINYYDMKYNPVKCETFIWTNDTTRTLTVTDSIYNITETITWTRGKITEHHFYTTEYSGKKISKMTIYNGMMTPHQRQYVISYLPTETLVTPENGEPIHLELSLEDAPPPPPMPPLGSNPFTYKTRKMEGNLARYDYFNFKVSTKPLLTMWFSDKGVMVKSVSGNNTVKRSYQYR